MEPNYSNNEVINGYEILKTIDKDSFVYMVKIISEKEEQIEQETNKYAALKMFKNKNYETDCLNATDRKILAQHDLQRYNNESSVAKNFDSNHVVKMIDNFIIKNEEGIEIGCIVYELCDKGDLFYYVSQQKFSEPMAKKMLKDMLEGLQYVNGCGYYHMDIKLENVFLKGKSFRFKISDFDQTWPTDEPITNPNFGTKGYQPPELLENQGQTLTGDKVQIFALGVMLFRLVCRIGPFDEALSTDDRYGCFRNKKQFWELQEKRGAKCSFLLTLLLNDMLEVDPEKRITFEGIIESEWFKTTLEADEETYIEEMKSIQKMMEQGKLEMCQ